MIHKSIEIEYADKKLSKTEFEQKITAFETQFSCKLPAVFKDFLHQYGNASLEVVVSILEPNPLCDEVPLDLFFGFEADENIIENTKIADGFPVAIPFAEDLSGNWYYLYLGHHQKESKVYFHDIQGRYHWTDQQFYDMFENLAPEIQTYLELRQNNQLPAKDEAFQDFYLVGNTFEEFISNLKPFTYED